MLCKYIFEAEIQLAYLGGIGPWPLGFENVFLITYCATTWQPNRAFTCSNSFGHLSNVLDMLLVYTLQDYYWYSLQDTTCLVGKSQKVTKRIYADASCLLKSPLEK